jgi:uncharacterized protein (UPF0332 family)
MTMSASDKADLARFRMAKAGGLVGDAETLLAASSYASSANRSYYAVLSAARGLLALRGLDAETHDGVKVLLSRDFIKPGIIAPRAAEIFRVLQARRMDSDYGDYVEIRQSEAEDSLEKAREFLALAGKTLDGLLEDPGAMDEPV